MNQKINVDVQAIERSLLEEEFPKEADNWSRWTLQL